MPKMIHVGQKVRVLRDLKRHDCEGVYVSAGTIGTVLEIFDSSSHPRYEKKMNAKVQTSDGIKTVRLTSIELAE